MARLEGQCLSSGEVEKNSAEDGFEKGRSPHDDAGPSFLHFI